MHTGDVGILGEDGYAHIAGRIKDMVIRGGENIFPREIEDFLLTHGDVLDVQVIGVPDKQLRRGAHGLGAHARGRRRRSTPTPSASSAAASSPTTRSRSYVHVVDDFPMTVTGKVRKIEMRENAVELLGLQNAAGTRHA